MASAIVGSTRMIDMRDGKTFVILIKTVVHIMTGDESENAI